MSEFWGYDPSLHSMPQGYQFAQQAEAIGPQPGQHDSEYPTQAQPQDYSSMYSQQSIANEHQKHGSHMHNQGPYPVPSADYGVAQPHYTGSGAFQAPNMNQYMVLGSAQNLNFNHQINNQAYYTPAVAPTPTYGGPPQVGYGTINAADPPYYSDIDPALFEDTPQATLQQSTMPQETPQQSTMPQDTLQQSTIPQATLQQSTMPQDTLQQSTIPQATLQQSTMPQATLQQSTMPQETLQQSTMPQATILQEVPPQPSVQQPNITLANTPCVHVPQAAIQPSPVTFEEKKALFLPVPEPRPEPSRRAGPGRKKKKQRFWAPEGASEDLKRHYRNLQTCDERVSTAEKKLAANSDPSLNEHLQKIVLRNMKTREEVWDQCRRMEQGLVAVEMDLEAAKRLVQEHHQRWEKQREVVNTRINSLRMNYPSAVDGNGRVDGKQLNEKEKQGFQSMQNWYKKKWQEFTVSLSTLDDAIKRTYGLDSVTCIITGPIIIEIGCYEGWSRLVLPGDSPEAVASRQYWADPAVYEQALAEHSQNLQLGNGQSAEYPHANLGHGAGLDQAVGVDAQPAQDQPQPQIQQDHVSEEDPERLAYSNEEQGMAVTEDSNIKEPFVFDESPQQLRDFAGEEELAPIAAWLNAQSNPQGQQAPVDEEMEGEHMMTHQEFVAVADAFYPDTQLGPLQGQEEAIESTINEMERQGLVWTDAQVADVFGTIGPDGEFQPPQGQEAPVAEEMEGVQMMTHEEGVAEGNAFSSGAQLGEDQGAEDDSQSLVSITSEDLLAELDGHEDEEAGIEFEDVPLPHARLT